MSIEKLQTEGIENARSSDITERIFNLIDSKFFQFQALIGHFVYKKMKII